MSNKHAEIHHEKNENRSSDYPFVGENLFYDCKNGRYIHINSIGLNYHKIYFQIHLPLHASFDTI